MNDDIRYDAREFIQVCRLYFVVVSFLKILIIMDRSIFFVGLLTNAIFLFVIYVFNIFNLLNEIGRLDLFPIDSLIIHTISLIFFLWPSIKTENTMLLFGILGTLQFVFATRALLKDDLRRR